MKLKKIILENFRLFEKLELEFPDSNLVAIIGNNGAGKTSILDAIALCFTHFTGSLISSTENYNIDTWFTEDDVTNGFQTGKATIDFIYDVPNNNKLLEFDDDKFTISVLKNRNEVGLKFDKKPKDFTKSIKNAIINEAIKTIPIIAYYNVNRTNNNITPITKPQSTYNEILFAYERALSTNSPNFKDFEAWYIKQETLENAIKVNKKDLDFELESIKNVRKAFTRFLTIIEPNVYSSLSIIRSSNLKPGFEQDITEYLAIVKNGKTVRFNQMSSGERMIIALVCDIARRLSIANENTEKALEAKGVVLIDELELHLHPNWQRLIIYALQDIFPNIQFIFTTHSPLVLSGVRRNSILICRNGEFISNSVLPEIYSATADEILEKILIAEPNVDYYDVEKHNIDLLFNQGEFNKAQKLLNELKVKVNASPRWLLDYERRILFAKS